MKLFILIIFITLPLVLVSHSAEARRLRQLGLTYDGNSYFVYLITPSQDTNTPHENLEADQMLSRMAGWMVEAYKSYGNLNEEDSTRMSALFDGYKAEGALTPNGSTLIITDTSPERNILMTTRFVPARSPWALPLYWRLTVDAGRRLEDSLVDFKHDQASNGLVEALVPISPGKSNFTFKSAVRYLKTKIFARSLVEIKNRIRAPGADPRLADISYIISEQYGLTTATEDMTPVEQMDQDSRNHFSQLGAPADDFAVKSIPHAYVLETDIEQLKEQYAGWKFHLDKILKNPHIPSQETYLMSGSREIFQTEVIGAAIRHLQEEPRPERRSFQLSFLRESSIEPALGWENSDIRVPRPNAFCVDLVESMGDLTGMATDSPAPL